MKKVLLILIFCLVIQLINAELPSRSLHINLQTTDDSGGIVTGSFTINLTIYTDSSCLTNSVYSYQSSLTTDSRGILSIYLNNTQNIDFSEQLYLGYFRNSVLKSCDRIVMTPYSETTRILLNESNQNIGDKNFTTTGSGFFGWIGSQLTRITKGWFIDLNISNNLEVNQNVTASYFKGNGSQITDVSGNNIINTKNWINNTGITTLCNSSGSCFTLSELNASSSGSTYNATYEGSVNNASYLSTFNSSYDSKVSFNSTNLAYLNNSNTFTGNNTFTGLTNFTEQVNIIDKNLTLIHYGSDIDFNSPPLLFTSYYGTAGFYYDSSNARIEPVGTYMWTLPHGAVGTTGLGFGTTATQSISSASAGNIAVYGASGIELSTDSGGTTSLTIGDDTLKEKGAREWFLGGATYGTLGIYFYPPTGQATFNEQGNPNGDFRVESDNDANMFLVDASADVVNISKLNVQTNLSVTDRITTKDLNVTGTSYLGSNILNANNISTTNIKSLGSNINFWNGSNNQKMILSETGQLALGTTSLYAYDFLKVVVTSTNNYLFGFQIDATQQYENYWAYGGNIASTRNSNGSNTGTTYGLSTGITYNPTATGTTDSGDAIGTENDILFTANNWDNTDTTFTKTGDTTSLITSFTAQFGNNLGADTWTVDNLYDFQGKGIDMITDDANDELTINNAKRFYVNDFCTSTATNCDDVTIVNYTAFWIDALDSNVKVTNKWGLILDGDNAGSDIIFGADQDAKIYWDGTNLVFNTNITNNGIAWFSRNVSATGYITRTSVYDKTKGDALKYIKDSSSYLKTDKSINHSAFYGYTTYPVPDYSKPIYTNHTEEICDNDVFYDNETKTDFKTNTISCENSTTTKVTYENKLEEGVNLGSEIDVLRQSVYDLKTELCLYKPYSWCLK